MVPAPCVSCGNCPEGQYRSKCDGGTATPGTCLACPQGYVKAGSNPSRGCTKCAKGRYQPNAKMGSCKSCPAGFYQGAEGSTGCPSCLSCVWPIGAYPSVRRVCAAMMSPRVLACSFTCALCRSPARPVRVRAVLPPRPL